MSGDSGSRWPTFEGQQSAKFEAASSVSNDVPVVLLVDDDDMVRGAHQKALERCGISVHATGSATAALALLGAGAVSFDVIISDIVMPEMDGVALLREIRQSSLDIPVILLTGYPQVSTAVAAVNWGSFKYLTKPIETHALVDAVNEAVGLHRLVRLKRMAFEITESNPCPGDRGALDMHFSRALDGIWMAFQPIVDVSTQSVFGYEALVRSTSSVLDAPAALLDAAERLGLLHELGRAIRRRVAARIKEAPSDSAILVNLHASDLNDDQLYDAQSPLAAHARRVVLEITERSSLDQVRDVPSRVSMLRKLGYRIAVDDLGVGYAGLASFSLLEPDLVKLDLSLIRDVDNSLRKQNVIKSMVSVCERELGMQVVCEGVETASECDTLRGLGATLMQGYWFGRPSAEFSSPLVAPVGNVASATHAGRVVR